MGVKFAAGKKAIAICDRCGFQYKLKDLRETTVKMRRTGLLVCKECWEPDQPQNMQGMYPVVDPQALRKPRPDNNLVASRDIQWGWNPVGLNNVFGLSGIPDSLAGTGSVGTVTVEIT